MMSRRPFIAGNWKMNMTAESGKALIKQLIPLVKDADCDVALCVPAILIPAMTEAAKGTNIKIGAENVHWAKSGAYTGEISADMLKEYGVEYAIIGHSERRQYFGETDEGVNKRTLAALANDITPIVCVGETLEERENGSTERVLFRQLKDGLNSVEDITKVVIAYEPVWAIGTGRTATNEQAEQTIAYIRATLANLFGKANADEVIIQYGGSMNAGNCKGLMAQPDIDGGLIGGASLKLDFATIVNYNKVTA
jgi:triosephosphate isomerase